MAKIAVLLIDLVNSGELSRGFYDESKDTGGFDSETLVAVENDNLLIIKPEMVRNEFQFRKALVDCEEDDEGNECLVISDWELI